MIGISIAAKREWNAILNKLNISIDDCKTFPFGEYFQINLYEKDLIFYRSGVRKTNCSASTQYMIDRFNLEKVIVMGTCAGIDDAFKNLDILIPNKVVQYDCTVKEIEPLIKDAFTVTFNLNNLPKSIKSGTLGTADKAVVMWKDYLELKENKVTIADTESAAIAYICKANSVECIILKGISDFPIKDNNESEEDSKTEQFNAFLTNVPIIMNTLIENYLYFAINVSIPYLD